MDSYENIELRDGLIVELENGDVGIIISGDVCFPDGKLGVIHYDSNFNYKLYCEELRSDYNIASIYQIEYPWLVLSSIKSYDKITLSHLGNIKQIWKREWTPKIGDIYFAPSISNEDGVIWRTWSNFPSDNRIKSRVGVYQTREDALEKCDELGWVD